MQFVLGIFGIACSILLIKYREGVGDAIGQPEWASKVGGIYNVLLICAIFGFFWSVATMTGTTHFLFSPIINLFQNNAS